MEKLEQEEALTDHQQLQFRKAHAANMVGAVTSVILAIVSFFLLSMALFPSDEEALATTRVVLGLGGFASAIASVILTLPLKASWRIMGLCVLGVNGATSLLIIAGRSFDSFGEIIPETSVLPLTVSLAFIGVALAYGASRRASVRFNLSPPGDARDSLRAFGSLLVWMTAYGFIVVYGLIVELLNLEQLTPSNNAEMLFTNTGGSIALTLVIAAIAAPVSEEFFFRGFILKSMRASFVPAMALGLSSMTFALFHADLTLLIPVFILGTAIGISFLWTRSLFMPITIHAIHNALVCSFGLLGSQR